MRKQTKIVALAAVLALGASFTSVAATYDWQLEDDGWYCYDEDGEPYDEEWVESYGEKYWVDEDGKMVTSSWVEDGDYTYYVNSEGKKTVSDWKFTFAEGEEDDDDAEEAWFYFNSKGRLETDKKITWNSSTYFVDKDGKMVTGWVEYDKEAAVKVQKADSETDVDNLVYVHEDGTRGANEWYYGFEAGLTEDEIAELEDDAQVYYWIEKDGSVATGKKTDINGQTYFFADAAAENGGQMLSGWVVKDGENVYKKATKSLDNFSATDVFYCGTKDQGWVKKDRWIKVVAAEDVATADDDTTKYWFFIAKNGKVFVPDNEVAITEMDFTDGEKGAKGFKPGSPANAELKEIEDETFLFNEDGKMLSGLYKIDGEIFYFGGADEGQIVSGSAMITDNYDDEYEVKFAKKAAKATWSNALLSKDTVEYSECAALNGNVDGYLYSNGIVQKSAEKGVYTYVDLTINNNTTRYLVNYKGKVQTDLDDEYDFGDEVKVKPSAKYELVDVDDDSVLYGSITTK